jgi:hypothetical protein
LMLQTTTNSIRCCCCGTPAITGLDFERHVRRHMLPL